VVSLPARDANAVTTLFTAAVARSAMVFFLVMGGSVVEQEKARCG
jgi:hypothetical protein